ncbi:37311_t:CDS:2 [Gigaspora margarita]|uniref:37311_t:CDS:1 n=1 Tax=Gigaspora margarita TaxID=4874 RepID=A0ABM8VXA2_GIGMA|nr:37311_t:CDS:2 [Gigaspora margarita]
MFFNHFEENSLKITNCVIGNIDQSTLEKINETVVLPLHQLIAPTSKNWSKESNEVKQPYELLADCAKQVHNIVYPHYSYKPKRKNFGYCFTSFPPNRVSQECPTSKNLHIQKKKSLNLEVNRNFTDYYDQKVWSLVDDYLII